MNDNQNIEGNRIIKLFNDGLDTESPVESVERQYKAAESAMLSNEPEEATHYIKKALKLLEDASSRIPGDLALPYSSGKCHLLLGSICLNQGNWKEAEKNYLDSKRAFSSRKWFHLEALAYLGLGSTYRQMAQIERTPQKLEAATDACYRARNSLEQEGMTLNIEKGHLTRVAQAINQEISKIENLIEEFNGTNNETANLKVFNISAGAHLSTVTGMTELNLISRNDYEYWSSGRPGSASIDLKACPIAQYADYILEIDADVDTAEDGLTPGDWLLIRDEKDHVVELSGKKVAVLLSEKGALRAGLKSFSQAEDHYFLKAVGKKEKGTSVVITPYRSGNLSKISDYYERYQSILKRYAYEVQISGEVVAHIPRADIHKVTKPIIWRIPVLNDIAAGVGGTIVETEVEDYVDLSDDEYIEADFGVKVVGDSMIDEGIVDGDIVLIRQQPTVKNGDIAAIVITSVSRPEPQGLLKRYCIVNKDDRNLRHLRLEAANPSSEHIVLMENSVDVTTIKEQYYAKQEAGQIPNPIEFHIDPEIVIAGTFVTVVRETN